MSEFATLSVQKRSLTGKGANRKLRAKGVIPAVFYTSAGHSIPVQVDEAPLKKLFETLGRTTIFNVEIDDNGKKETFPALIWDVDFYPTKSRMQHVDFFGVDLNKDIKLNVPLEFIGTAKGAKLGGVLETFTEFVELLGKPLALPNKVLVDISPLDIGDNLRVADLALPEGVRPANDPTQTIVLLKDKSAVDESEAGGTSGSAATS